jgi:hypothetical protein
MTSLKLRIGFLSLLVATALTAQQPPAGASGPSADADACMRHCKEMSAARQKTMDQRDAAWKDIKAQVEAAKSLKGDKRVAALESAFEKLLAFHESMEHSMAMGAGQGMGMGCCAKHETEQAMGMGCCAKHGAEQAMGMDCCAKGGMSHNTMAMQHSAGGMQDCPMMKGEKQAPTTK